MKYKNIWSCKRHVQLLLTIPYDLKQKDYGQYKVDTKAIRTSTNSMVKNRDIRLYKRHIWSSLNMHYDRKFKRYDHLMASYSKVIKNIICV